MMVCLMLTFDPPNCQDPVRFGTVGVIVKNNVVLTLLNYGGVNGVQQCHYVLDLAQ